MTAGHWTQMIFQPSKITAFSFTLTDRHLSFHCGKVSAFCDFIFKHWQELLFHTCSKQQEIVCVRDNLCRSRLGKIVHLV